MPRPTRTFEGPCTHRGSGDGDRRPPRSRRGLPPASDRSPLRGRGTGSGVGPAPEPSTAAGGADAGHLTKPGGASLAVRMDGAFRPNGVPSRGLDARPRLTSPYNLLLLVATAGVALLSLATFCVASGVDRYLRAADRIPAPSENLAAPARGRVPRADVVAFCRDRAAGRGSRRLQVPPIRRRRVARSFESGQTHPTSVPPTRLFGLLTEDS
jgi:hypothetical protein